MTEKDWICIFIGIVIGWNVNNFCNYVLEILRKAQE